MNIPPTQFIVKNLDPNIDRKRFCSSDDDLNDYFYNDALRDLDYLYSITKVVIYDVADVGCRVITVDAKKDAVGFYRRFAFNPVCSKRRTDTVPMYLDIKPLRDANM